MKAIIVAGVLTLAIGSVLAQNPVEWKTSVKRLDAKTVEVHITATIAPNWHIYAQQQPENSISIPTSVVFRKNPLVLLVGPVEEIGKKISYKNEALALEDIHYEGQLDLVQKLSLKGPVKTSLGATVQYQACTNEKCLPPATLPLTINL